MRGAFIGYETATQGSAWAALIGVTSDTSTSMFAVGGASVKWSESQETKGEMAGEILGTQAAFSVLWDGRIGALNPGGLGGLVINTGATGLWLNNKYANGP